MRISVKDLREKRRARSSRILITGGTGFLGSHIGASLLSEGYEVVWLARSDGRLGAAERVERLLDWFGVEPAARRKSRVIEGEFTRPRLGLESSVYDGLLSGIDEIIHCASDTSFSEKKRAALENANIAGLRNALELAEQGQTFFFHLLSTAYVAGRRSGLCPEELVSPAAFTNPYEETKCRAEGIAADLCRKAGIRLSIYRPSIVYGDSRSGRSLLFTALYYPVRTILFLKEVFEADIRKQGGRRAAAMGVRIEDDGWTELPLRMEIENGGGLDLVPVDFFVAAFAALMGEALEGGVFHIASGRPARLADIVAYGSRLFHLRGIEVCSRRDLGGAPRNALEVLFDRYVESYRPYLRDERTFAIGRGRPILERRGISCPDLSYEIFCRCMNFAVECDWGARLFPK
jgi:nucleoside-diphosphate-sugar epimerase